MKTKNFLIFALIILPFVIIEARLLHIQIISQDDLSLYRKGKRVYVDVKLAPRGRILDRNGVVLATNEVSFDLYIVPYMFEKDKDGFKKLCLLLDIKPEDALNKLNKIHQRIYRYVLKNFKPKFRKKALKREKKLPRLFYRDIPMGVACQIETHPEIYQGLIVRENLRRFYPLKTGVSHIIGYLGYITPEHHARFITSDFFTKLLPQIFDEYFVKQIKQSGVLKNMLVGKSGIEKKFEHVLRGRPGIVVYTRGRATEVLRPVAGKDIYLTIDARLQNFAQKLLCDKKGAIVVMGVNDGSIYALVSSPGFDPNHFIPPTINDLITRYFHNPRHPLINRAQSLFTPGSVFKVVSAVAGLEEKKILPQTEFECQGILSKKLKYFRCWVYLKYGRGHGKLDLIKAMECSCNIYFYRLGRMIGYRNLVKWAKRFGFKIPFSYTDPRSLAIGQGRISATPLQIATMISVIANGGFLVQPKILRYAKPKKIKVGISQDTISILKKGLWEVVHGKSGTAVNTQLRLFDTAGKTGTAQVGRIAKPHAWFAGFYPYQNPRYAYVVFLERVGSGGQFAGPLAVKLVEKIKEYLK